MKEMFRLALPVVITYLGTMSMGLVDLLFVGRVSPEALASVGLGTSIFAWAMIFGIGLLSALEYTVSIAVGEGRKSDPQLWMVQGTWLAAFVSVPGTLLLFWTSGHLEQWFKVDHAVAELAEPYLVILAGSLFPVLAFTAKRLTFQAMGDAWPGLLALILGNILNVFLNARWVPELGATGSAWATFWSRWFLWTMLILFWTSRADTSFHWRLDRKKIRELLHVGGPTALQMTFEVGVFATATTLASQFVPFQQAAHQIVLNTASMTFMVPLGISAASAVLVGTSLGKRNRAQAIQRGWAGLALGVGFMAISAVSLAVLRHWVALGYTPDAQTVQYAAQLFVIAALFQLSDGTQTVLGGVLRGFGKTKASAVWNLVGHWFVGLPVGLYLAFRRGMEVQGLWIGLSLGLTVVAAGLFWEWLRLTRVASR